MVTQHATSGPEFCDWHQARHTTWTRLNRNTERQNDVIYKNSYELHEARSGFKDSTFKLKQNNDQEVFIRNKCREGTDEAVHEEEQREGKKRPFV